MGPDGQDPAAAAVSTGRCFLPGAIMSGQRSGAFPSLCAAPDQAYRHRATASRVRCAVDLHTRLAPDDCLHLPPPPPPAPSPPPTSSSTPAGREARRALPPILA
ncbi:hypothetical protein ACP4OV_012660 [Aristida adscensionis]